MNESHSQKSANGHRRLMVSPMIENLIFRFHNENFEKVLKLTYALNINED